MSKPYVYTPIATGSTEPRDIRDRFADFVNLKDFGAVGDGVTNDMVAWTAWRTALQNGGTPYIPKGNYLLGEEILHAPKGHIGRNTNSFSYADDGLVINEFSAVVYIDPNGNDINDGMTAGTAVRTITKALEIAKELPQQSFIFQVKAGNYTGNLVFGEGRTVEFNINGDVSISGYIQIYDNSCLIIKNSDNVQHTITVTASDISNAIYISYGSYLKCLETDLYIIANNVTDYTVLLTDCSGASFKSISITGTDAVGGVRIFGNSSLTVSDMVDISNIITNGHGITVEENSRAKLNFGNGTMYATGTNSAIRVFNGSTMSISGNKTINHDSGASRIITCTKSSYLIISGSTTITTSTCHSFFVTGECSSLYLGGGYELLGTVTNATIDCSGNSFVTVPPTTTFTDHVTGNKVHAEKGGQIDIMGATRTKIPGTTNGSVDANTFAYCL